MKVGFVIFLLSSSHSSRSFPSVLSAGQSGRSSSDTQAGALCSTPHVVQTQKKKQMRSKFSFRGCHLSSCHPFTQPFLLKLRREAAAQSCLNFRC